ncbi:hypothetical protein [Ktedonosporobacter rubrisoli]|nr:hypothetical protein [Ktedonosporobacter rubrisoli]
MVILGGRGRGKTTLPRLPGAGRGILPLPRFWQRECGPFSH